MNFRVFKFSIFKFVCSETMYYKGELHVTLCKLIHFSILVSAICQGCVNEHIKWSHIEF